MNDNLTNIIKKQFEKKYLFLFSFRQTLPINENNYNNDLIVLFYSITLLGLSCIGVDCLKGNTNGAKQKSKPLVMQFRNRLCRRLYSSNNCLALLCQGIIVCIYVYRFPRVLSGILRDSSCRFICTNVVRVLFLAVVFAMKSIMTVFNASHSQIKGTCTNHLMATKN